ncbi:MAG TPA: adenylate/guanylate cyclase domain-containing protein [Myxococcales bacterium]|jgi:class 3 adenylate cyclase
MSGDGGDRKDPLAQTRHDLRNCVNQILGYSELLEEESQDAGFEAAIPSLKKIQSAARQQLDLIAALKAASPATAAAPAPPAREAGEAGEAGEARPSPRPATLVGLEPVCEVEAGEALGRILVVDDVETNRELLQKRLEAKGFVVAVAEDGPRALAAIEAGAFDAVVLDVEMPGLTGLEVLVRLRRTRSASDLPVIMATARDTSDDVVEALRLGANDYVTKPLDMPVVLARLRTQLALKRQSDRIKQLVQELDLRNRFIQETFGRFLSDEVVRGLLETPGGLALGGESRKVTILMSDLRGFTAMSERLGAEQVVRIINRYLGAMADVILSHRGTIDEFIGDAVLAIFGAPVAREDDARRALACAVAMQQAIVKVNEQNLADGLPALEMGIAVHTGVVVVGNIGSERRTKYGIVGAAVNLTGRIESCTVGGQVLVSEATLREAEGFGVVGGSVEVKAKGAKVPVLARDLKSVRSDPEAKVPERVLALEALSGPLPVHLVVVEGKCLADGVLEAEITALGPLGARLRCEAPLGLLRDVKLSLLACDGAELEGEAYAKVVEELPAEGSYHLRFTSLSAEMSRRLREIAKASEPTGVWALRRSP